MTEKEVTLTGNEIKNLMFTGLIEELKGVSLSGVPLITTINTKHCMINPDIEVSDLNSFLVQNGGQKVESFLDFIMEFYAVNTTKIIKDYLPYPINERIKTLPVVSFTPGKENPKFIQFSF